MTCIKEKKSKVNEDYLLLLNHKPNSNEIYIDRKKIDKPLNHKLDRFIELCDNPSVELNEIKHYFSNWSEVHRLVGYHKYCRSLNNAGEGFNVNVLKTIELIEEKQVNLDSKKKSKKSYDEELLAFKKELKNNVLLWFTSSAITETYNKLRGDSNNIIYSHRKRGWEMPAYQIHPDFSIQVKTNFGYGRSSYFYTKINFKGLDIVPFTDWINYQFAELTEIIRYSSKHKLVNESWHEAFAYILKAYNVFLNDETEDKIHFIKIYIVEVCDNFVVGLNRILTADYVSIKEHKFLNLEKEYVDFDYEQHSLNEFKGKKISGALEFIPKMEEFKTVTKVAGFIKDIEKANQTILPILKDEYITINEKLNELYLELDIKEEEVKHFKQKINDIEERKYYELGLTTEIEMQRMKYDLLKTNHDYSREKNKLLEAENKCIKLRGEISRKTKTEVNLLCYIEKISLYFHDKHIDELNSNNKFKEKIVLPNNNLLNEVALIPYRIGKEWYLFDSKYKKLIKKTEIIDKDSIRSWRGFYLCHDDKYYSILINKKEYPLGVFHYMIRNGEYILGLDYRNNYNLYYGHKFICTIPKSQEVDSATKFDVLNDELVHLRTHHISHGGKYIEGQNWESIGFYDFSGSRVNIDLSNEEMELLNHPRISLKSIMLDCIPFERSDWRIEMDGLYFGEDIKYAFKEMGKSFDCLEHTSFSYGFAYLRFFDYCPEFGESIDNLGFIDMYGNCYWE